MPDAGISCIAHNFIYLLLFIRAVKLMKRVDKHIDL